MAGYRFGKSRSRLPRRLFWLAIVLAALIAAGVIITHLRYNSGLKPVSSDQTTVLFTVERGSSVKDISDNLEKEHLIRSAWAMQLYIHSKELGEKLQAGTYAFSPSQGTVEITKLLTHGEVSTRLVTILPGRRIDQVRADLINDGFTPQSVDAALSPAQYSDLPVLTYKPQDINTLEGLLWPDSYQRDASTSPEVIIRESLIAMGEHLTPDVQAAFAAQGLSTYQGLTLTSIVTQEVSKPADQTQVAQVFFSRMRTGMVLGSDVTAIYGSVAAGHTPSLTYDSPYNTLQHPGLPPSPISTITLNALNATIHPAGTDWLYFVAGDDGTTYFAHTFEEHQANIQKYCHKLCAQ